MTSKFIHSKFPHNSLSIHLILLQYHAAIVVQGLANESIKIDTIFMILYNQGSPIGGVWTRSDK